MRVFDFSSHNTILDWSLIKDNCDAVILRCGYRGYGSSGNLVKDKKYDVYRQKCKEFGIPYGVYFFPTSISIAEAWAEADFIRNLVSDDQLCFPIFLDSEIADVKNKAGRSDNLSKEERTEYLLANIERLAAFGYKAGVYASTSWFSSRLNDKVLLNYPHWVAQYASKCKYSGSIYGWQYTSKYELPGAVKAPFDCSTFYLSNSVPVVVATPTLRKGAKSENVRSLQRNLQMCGYTLDADGSYWKITERIVKDFQRDNGLQIDGIYGPKSYAKMLEILGG